MPLDPVTSWRRLLSAASLLLLTAVLAACAPSVSGPQPAPATPGAPGSPQADMHPACRADDFVVTVSDPALLEALTGPQDKEAGSATELRCSQFAKLVNLRASGVADLSGLEYAVNLSNVTLRDSPVTSLEPLARLPRLQSLTVSGGRLSSLEPVRHMPALLSLDVTNSSVSDLSPLASVPALAYLKANDNAISDISALAGLTQLAWVDLSGNLITDVSAFSSNRTVETLLLNDNLITSAAPLGGLTQLQRIELANNQLTELGFLLALRPRSVNLSGNYIGTVNAVAQNGYIDGSRTVDLRHNCIDLGSGDPFTRDVVAIGGRVLLEPQRDDCTS